MTRPNPAAQFLTPPPHRLDVAARMAMYDLQKESQRELYGDPQMDSVTNYLVSTGPQLYACSWCRKVFAPEQMASLKPQQCKGCAR